MSFLAPLFLFGALAVAAPVIFHLIRRTSREKMPFSSLMFLQSTPPRMTRQNRLENIFLLILRCLVLLLLALGFSRPFFQKPVSADPGTGAGRRLVVLLDASASMQQDGLWTEARRKVEQALRDVTPADSVSLLVFDRSARPLVSFEQWKSTPAGERLALLTQRLASANPGWAGTHLGHALLTAVEALEDNSGRDAQRAATGPRRIVVVSDLQEGAHLDGLQGFEWPRGIEVVLEPIKPRRPTNAGLSVMTELGETDQPAAEPEFKVRVVNASVSKREQLQVGWSRPGEKSFAGAPIDAYVPPGQSRVFTAPKPPAGLAPEHLKLSGDDEDFDNNVYIVRPKPDQIKVLYLGREAEADSQQPLFFLKRAFQQTRRQDVQVVARPVNAPLTKEDLVTASVLIVSDALSSEAAASVRAFLEAGKTVLFLPKDAGSTTTLAEIAGLGSVSAEEALTDGYALLGQIDFAHPLFAPFADPRFSDFTKIHFWKHRRLDAGQFKNARVLARFDKGDPALLQLPAGKGTLLVLTSGWHPTDSQLALSSKFVPFLYSLLELSGGVKAQLAQYFVGDPVALSVTNAAGEITVRRPDGTEVKIAAGERFTQTDLPGIYIVNAGGATQRFAVNLDFTESKTTPLPLEELERLGLPLKPISPDAVKKEKEKLVLLQNAELENRQKLWRWLLVAALTFLLFETAVAAWVTRRGTAAPTA